MDSRVRELRGRAMNLPIRSKRVPLVDVMIALLVLAIALLVLEGLMVTTTRNSSLGGHMTEARGLGTNAVPFLYNYYIVGSIGQDQMDFSLVRSNCEVREKIVRLIPTGS